jgi:uncharacterized RDD family membrane protein YckC
MPSLADRPTLLDRMHLLAPEADQLQGRRAGVVTRSIAFGIDFFCVLIGYPLILWFFAVIEAIFTFSPPSYPDLPSQVDAVLYAIWIPLYFSGSWLLSGRTIGQGIMGIRVVGRTTIAFGPVRALLRFWVLFATLLIAPVWIACSKTRLGIHDRATRTQVVYDARPRKTVVDVALAPGGGGEPAVSPRSVSPQSGDPG